MTALIIGTLLALGALAFVLYPLFRGRAGDERSANARGRAIVPEDPVAALREIEFDRETGKLSDSDYAALKASYTRMALDVMRTADNREAERSAAEDLAEAAILRYRARAVACPSCGPRPEPDAAFCSSCGRNLAASCSGCGAAITESGARFCTNCGRTLAA